MAKLSRATLKNYFKSGEMPSEQAFSNFIDSTVNVLDDNFSNSEDVTLKVIANNDRRTVISMYTEPNDKASVWNILLDKNGELSFRDSQQRDYMQFSPEGNINFNGENIFFNSKNITQGILNTCVTDCKWHNITPLTSGIDMYEISAVYKSGNKKNITTIQAMASHCYGRKRIIKFVRPFAFFWQNRLKLRWKILKYKKDNTVKIGLYIKSKYSNKDGTIQYCIKQIWNNE